LGNGDILYRDEIIQVMVDTVENMNRQRAIEMGVSSLEIDNMLNNGRNELMQVSALLFDALYEYGVINDKKA
jgi:hypothetical protein